MPTEDVNDQEFSGEDRGNSAEPDLSADEQEAVRRLQEEISRLSVADHLLLMLQSLSSLAVDRLALAPESGSRKDLDQARLAIDAFRAILGVLESQRPVEEMMAHRSVLSQLQVAYVSALSPASALESDAETS